MSAHHKAGQNLDITDTVHEHSDINVRAIIGFMAVLTAIVLGIDVAMWGLFRVLHNYEVKNDPYVTPLANPGQPPPEPALQLTPWADLKTFSADEHRRLTNYSWVDEKAGVARIPISKAKELLLQRGIPVRPELADPSLGTNRAATGDSSGGRNLPSGTVVEPAAAPAPAPAPHAPPVKPGGGGQ
jgi:hypothetical protein